MPNFSPYGSSAAVSTSHLPIRNGTQRIEPVVVILERAPGIYILIELAKRRPSLRATEDLSFKGGDPFIL